MDICIDFDGTCVTHEFPKVGRDIGAVPVLKALVAKGHRLILFTMRSNKVECEPADPAHPEIIPVPGCYLNDAIKWFKDNEIPLYGIQSNPTQLRWTGSPKAYGHLYIDDAALGCPLVQYMIGKPHVDWPRVQVWLRGNGIL